MRDFDSPFWRAPKGSLLRAQAELDVRVRQLWRSVGRTPVMRFLLRHAIEVRVLGAFIWGIAIGAWLEYYVGLVQP